MNQPLIFISAGWLEWVFFALGYMLRGLVLAIMSELIWRPLAKKVRKDVKGWETKHPIRYWYLLHYLEGHLGRPNICIDCGSTHVR